jgi:hypothetical protein
MRDFASVIIFLLAFVFGVHANSSSTNLPIFGFAGPETFPIDNFIGNLRSADLNGDGLEDLIVVNNTRSKITLLYNQTGNTNKAAPRWKRELNELPPDARFRIDSIASEKRIAGLVVADLNGDKRPDIAYYGEPKELVVQYNDGTNGFGLPKRWPIDDGQLTPNALAFGDLNGDKRNDLLVLGDSHLYFLAQRADRLFGEPEKIPYSGAVKSAQILDINGDERDDLLLVNWDNANPFRFRLQNAARQLGPEMHFSLPPIRSYWADDLDGDHKTEIMTIAQQSGRAQISNFGKKASVKLAGTFNEGQFQVLPLNKTTKSKRGSAWSDINGDERPDLLVAEPDSGQLTVYLQQEDGSLAHARTFSTLTGITEISVASDTGEIYLLSPDERQVGVTQLDKQGRIPFPRILPMEGKPLAMAVGPLKVGRGVEGRTPVPEPSSLAVILDQDGKRVLWSRSPGGEVTSQKLSENFKANPTLVAFHDADHDGLQDLIVLIPYEKMKILRQVQGANFEELEIAPPGGSLEQPWMSATDVDGDGKKELLLAQKNFVRAVVLKSEASKTDSKTWSFTVKDQINGASSSSRIVGATPLRNGTNSIASLFLLDAERKALTLCERDTNGAWQVVRNVSLPFTEFNDLQSIAVGAKKPNTIAFFGPNAVGWMSLAGEIWEIADLDGYETPIKDGHLHDVVSGDLNQDGRRDLVFLETGKNHLDLVIFDLSGKLVPANRWQVFEERTFRGRRGDQPEPREALIIDVTGDRKNDLAVVVHDRVLVYPQE